MATKPRASTIIAAIVAKMKKRKLTVYAMAKATGHPYTTVHRILSNGNRGRLVQVVEDMAKVAGVRLP